MNRKGKQNVFELGLILDRKVSRAAVPLVPVDSTHLVVSQNLLPFLYETGALGGRTFDVLMTRLPMKILHERLDQAYISHPESKTLHDFRAPDYMVDLESKALTKARKIITPHEEIAELFRNKAEKLTWKMPVVKAIPLTGNKILFPASAIGRKGAYEVKRLVREHQLHLTVSGRLEEEQDFWEDLPVEYFTGDYSSIALVIYPVYVENQPRQILKALAHSIPVITTPACGLPASPLVKILENHSFDELAASVNTYIKHTCQHNSIT